MRGFVWNVIFSFRALRRDSDYLGATAGPVAQRGVEQVEVRSPAQRLR